MRIVRYVASRLVSPRVGVALCALLCSTALMAAVVTLTFEGLKDNEEILNYYNGGTGSQGSGPGPNYGISFGPDALAIIEQAQGGTGNFQNEPSSKTIAFFTSGPGVVMNVPAGFTTGFSFYYAAANVGGSVTVYDGLDGTGNVLATVPFSTNGSDCNGSTYTFSCWSPVGVTFSGTAKSVNFSGGANQVGFDNITLGSSTPGSSSTVPAASQWALVLLAILLLGVAAQAFRSLSSVRT